MSHEDTIKHMKSRIVDVINDPVGRIQEIAGPDTSVETGEAFQQHPYRMAWVRVESQLGEALLVGATPADAMINALDWAWSLGSGD